MNLCTMPGKSWNTLRQEITRCRACRLHRYRSHAVLPEGNPSSGIMVIGQSPGKTENSSGTIFSGPSGKVFDRLLFKAGIDRETIYLTNLLKCMLPRARRPRQDEIAACLKYLDMEMALVRPQIVVPLGFHVLKTLLQRFNLPVPDRTSMKHLFGLKIPRDPLIIFPLRHPTALLFNPEKQEIMERNYRTLGKIIHTDIKIPQGNR